MRYWVNERSSAYPTHLSWICATIYYIRSAYLLVMGKFNQHIEQTIEFLKCNINST